jgi:type VI secretion system protein ImpH
MDAKGRRSLPDLTGDLSAAAGAFDFVQAVRLAIDAGAARETALLPPGHDENPSDESVHFTSAASLGFAWSPVRHATRRASGQLVLEVGFLGLTGPIAALPQHYTELQIDRLQRRDRAMAEFLDIFHHRAASLFYRAAVKYRVAHSHESAWRWHARREAFRGVLESLVGRRPVDGDVRETMPGRAWLYFAAHFARSGRSATALESLLTDFLGLPTRVQQFVGRWVEIPHAARSALPSRAHPRGRNLELGQSFVLGQRSWDVSSRIRVCVGPMSRERFLELRPDGELMARLRRIVDDFSDGTLDFEVELTLAQGERLETRLSVQGPDEVRLGWTSRLAASAPERAQRSVLFSLAAVG